MPKFPTLEHMDFAYTAIPDYFLDHIAPTLKECELRVMLYIYRRTLGYRKLADTISYEQFLNGITTRDGKKLDAGAGVSRRSLVGALSGLVNRGLVIRTGSGFKSASIIELCQAAFSDTSVAGPYPGTEANSIAPVPPTVGSPQAEANRQNLKDSLSSRNSQPVRWESSQRERVDHNALAVKSHETKVGQNLPTTEVSPPPTVRPLPGQNLPDFKRKKKQILLSTIDTNSNQNIKTQKPEDTRGPVILDPVMVVSSNSGCTPNFSGNINPGLLKHSAQDQAEALRLITSQIPGIRQGEAKQLVNCAFENGRDISYVKQIVTYVNSTSAIKVPAAVLTTLIKTNQERQPGRSKAVIEGVKTAYPDRLPSFERTHFAPDRAVSTFPFAETMQYQNDFSQPLNSASRNPQPDQKAFCIAPDITTTEHSTCELSEVGLASTGCREAVAPAPMSGEGLVKHTEKTDFEELWHKATSKVLERWQFDRVLFEGGSLVTESLSSAIVINLPNGSSLARIRLSQTIKELLYEKGNYEYSIRW